MYYICVCVWNSYQIKKNIMYIYMHVYTYTYYIFICSINMVLMPLQGLGRGSSRLWSFGLMSSYFMSGVYCPLVSAGSVGSHAVHFVFHGPKLLYWSLSVHFVPVCSIFLELVALDYQPLGLSPVPGWWRMRMASCALKRIVSKCHQLLLMSTE